MNSIRNKIDAVADEILENVDILCIGESKLDSSFPAGQFSVRGFKNPIRFDVTNKSGGLLLYVRTELNFQKLCCPAVNDDIQCIMGELNLRKQMWLIISIYRNPKQDISYFLENLTKILDFYSQKYENIIVMGDFNAETSQSDMTNFMLNFNLYNLIKTPTCYKSSEGKCIDLMLTTKKKSFQYSNTFETGISDHHHLIYTMFKTTFEKSPPQIVEYRTFKNFSRDTFRTELSEALAKSAPGDFDSLSSIFERVLDVHAPKKKRIIRGNHKPYLTKALRKAIMIRSSLKNKANKTGDIQYLNLYKKQRNYVVKLNRQTKKSHFLKLGTSPNFWEASKSLFSKCSYSNEKICLRENSGGIIKEENEISEILNSFFVNVTDSLNITPWETCSNKDELHNVSDIVCIVQKYRDHPSIKAILSSKRQLPSSFAFSNVTSEEVNLTILKLNPKKSVSGPFPTKIVRMVADIICGPVPLCLNSTLKSGTFPHDLKLAHVTPAFKKGDKFLKENYRPISILPSLSKIYERIIFNQLAKYFDNILHSQLCGFRAKYSTHHALLRMIGRWHQCLDRSGKVGAILMDLSKAFDCIDHELLIAKLAAYGLDPQSLKLLKCYLNNRFQRTKVGSTLSTWLRIMKGVPQGSILGPLLFNIFINDLLFFVEKTEICNYVDDNSIYTCKTEMAEVMSDLTHDLPIVLSWFKKNQLAANPSKFQMLVLGEPLPITISAENVIITSTESVELLGVCIDNNLNFSSYISSLCHKASNRLRSLNRIRSYLNTDQAKLLLNSFILSLFNYAPIVWMF